MTPHIALSSTSATTQGRSGFETPVLIRVPAMDASPRRRAGASSPHVTPRRVRRRLRREIRVAASALVFALPMSWALLTFANMDSPESSSVALASTNQPDDPSFTMDQGPGVTITLETSPEGFPTDVPIVMPAGYLVPDDGAGDAAHEGY